MVRYKPSKANGWCVGVCGCVWMRERIRGIMNTSLLLWAPIATKKFIVKCIAFCNRVKDLGDVGLYHSGRAWTTHMCVYV